MVKVTSLLIKAGSALGFSFGVRAQTEMKMWHTKGMYKLKVVSSKKCKLKRPKVILHAPRTNTIHISMTSCQNPATNIWH